MIRKSIAFILLVVAVSIVGAPASAKCIFGKKKKKQKMKTELVQPVFATGPAMIIYKTKANYNQNVPVILSADKSSIVSYPAPSDISRKSEPTQLINGYLLDNRGIGVQVAFTSLTYNEYATMTTAPELAKLQGLIIDADPITEMYNCGLKTSYSNSKEQLNAIIEAGKLNTICKKLK